MESQFKGNKSDSPQASEFEIQSTASEFQTTYLRDKSKEERECLLSHWNHVALSFQGKFKGENDSSLFCDPVWDNIYCWPPAKAGETTSRSCLEILQLLPEMRNYDLSNVTGDAYRICTESGNWLWGSWTNYTECSENIEDDAILPSAAHSGSLVIAVRYILFIGSILSFLSLVSSLAIFYHFKCLRCDRIKVHIHLMIALAFRFLLLILITEPFIFHRDNHYRSVDWICKGVLSLLMYATVASINWMFIQGHYLHGRLTTNVFDRGTPFKIYYSIGWGLPLILILVWACIMEVYHPIHCWKGFAELNTVWIIVGPMLLALGFNLLFLINIMRILLTKVHRTPSTNDAAQFRRAVKATALLFPLLGINNLLFVYNPGGSLENLYMLANTICLSSQGVLVSVLYCFVSSDVRDAIRREYRRFLARRSATGSTSRRQNRQKGSFTNSFLMLTPRSRLTPTNTSSVAQFRTQNVRIQNVETVESKSPNLSADGDVAINFLNAGGNSPEEHHNPLSERVVDDLKN